MSGLKTFLVVVPICLVIDLIWLGIVMKGFYSQELGDLARRNGDSIAPRWAAAILVYLLIPGGLVLFVRPILGDQGTLLQALGWGALFGLVVYGVYDLTNLAVLERWTLRVTVVDILWGAALCAATSAAMHFADRWMRA